MRLAMFPLAAVLALAGCQPSEPAESAAVPPAAEAPSAMPADTVAGGPAEIAADTGAAMPHVGLMVADAWTRPLAPGASVAAGYGGLMNHGTQADTLIGARAEGVGRIEIHTMREVDGVMQMRPLEGGLAVPVDGVATLAPGGDHLMFFEVTRSWVEGDTVRVTLLFASGTEVPVEFAVRKGSSAGTHQHH